MADYTFWSSDYTLVSRGVNRSGGLRKVHTASSTVSDQDCIRGSEKFIQFPVGTSDTVSGHDYIRGSEKFIQSPVCVSDTVSGQDCIRGLRKVHTVSSLFLMTLPKVSWKLHECW